MEKLFDKYIEHILNFEGGYSNHPNDPGGETRYGISKSSYPKLDILNLTKEVAIKIYKEKYWAPINGDALPPGISFFVLDMAVNHGVFKAVSLMQRALGVKADGDVGPATLERIQGFPLDRLLHQMAILRLAEYHAKNWEHFGKGWSKRIMLCAMLSALYLKMV